MQLLSPALKSNRTKSLAADEPAACARAVLDGMPPVMWFIRKQMRKHRTGGLSVPQFRALCLLSQFPTASVSLVAEHLGSSTPSASRLVTGLVSRGFVTRKACRDDRRQVTLVMTQRGKSVLAAAQQATQDRLAEQMEQLSPEQRAAIASAMVVLGEVFGATL
jgi:DNA-binding MarR family transcriptional regulator